jgi:hypothetical protein
MNKKIYVLYLGMHESVCQYSKRSFLIDFSSSVPNIAIP